MIVINRFAQAFTGDAMDEYAILERYYETIAADTFNRPDDALSLGITEIGGKTWNVGSLGQVWGIKDGTAGRKSGSGGPTMATVDAAAANFTVSATLRNTPSGIVFRESWDPTTGGGFLLYWNGTAYTISRRSAGQATGFSNLKSTTGITPTAGDKVAVTVNGSSITAFVNGVQVLQVTDTAYPTNTLAGMWAGGATGGIDDFKITNQTEV